MLTEQMAINLSVPEINKNNSTVCSESHTAQVINNTNDLIQVTESLSRIFNYVFSIRLHNPLQQQAAWLTAC